MENNFENNLIYSLNFNFFSKMNEQVKEVVMKYQAKSPTSRINKEYT